MPDALIALRQQPGVVHLLFSLWRVQQVFVRSQLFFSARTLSGPAPLADKLQRLAARQRADWAAWHYDSAPLWHELLCAQSEVLAEWGGPPALTDDLRRWSDVAVQQKRRFWLDIARLPPPLPVELT